MILIEEILVSDEIFEEQFACNLSACKGACCWEGDYGAPLEDPEVHQLEALYPKIAPYMSPVGREIVEKEGVAIIYKDNNEFGTPLVANGPCAYMVVGNDGVAKCAIEAAYRDGAIDFLKPISCHLYPIRVMSNKKTGFEALNYDRWDICSAACTKGEREKISVFEFTREALIRKYGMAFYQEAKKVWEAYQSS